MRWKLLQGIAVGLLVLSIAVAALIYQYDGFLRSAAMTAAEGLLGLALLYVLALGVLAWRPNVGFPFAGVVALLSFAAQAVNAATGPPGLALPHGFWSYDFGFDAVGVSSACPYGCPPFRYSSLLLFLIQLPLAGVSAYGWVTLRRSARTAAGSDSAPGTAA